MAVSNILCSMSKFVLLYNKAFPLNDVCVQLIWSCKCYVIHSKPQRFSEMYVNGVWLIVQNVSCVISENM